MQRKPYKDNFVYHFICQTRSASLLTRRPSTIPLILVVLILIGSLFGLVHTTGLSVLKDEGLFVISPTPGTLIREGPEIMRTVFVKINFGLLGSKTQSASETLKLNLFSNAIYTARLDHQPRPGFSWTGHFDGIEFSDVVLSFGNQVMWGEIRMPGAVYWIRYAGNGVHAIYQVNESLFPPDAPTIPSSKGLCTLSSVNSGWRKKAVPSKIGSK